MHLLFWSARIITKFGVSRFQVLLRQKDTGAISTSNTRFSMRRCHVLNIHASRSYRRSSTSKISRSTLPKFIRSFRMIVSPFQYSPKSSRLLFPDKQTCQKAHTTESNHHLHLPIVALRKCCPHSCLLSRGQPLDG